MAAKCKFCSSGDPEVACHRCGVFACSNHYILYSSSNEATCDDCFLRIIGSAISTLIDFVLRLEKGSKYEVLSSLKKELSANQNLKNTLQVTSDSDDFDTLEKLKEVLVAVKEILENPPSDHNSG